MSTPSRELLIASPARWDEACFSVPAVRALAGSGLGIGVLCQPHQKAFWETLPGLPVRTPDALDEDWQVALLWEAGPLAKAVRKAGIPKRLGPDANGKLSKHLTETLRDRPHPTDHRVQFYLRAVAEMGVETAKPEYFAPVAQETQPDPKRILLIPDSDFGPSHEWPLDRWLDLSHALEEMPLQVTIGCSGQARGLDAGLCAIFSEEFEAVEIDPHQPDLSQLAHHRVVVAADGSLPHLAAHMGATCVTLFGPNDPRWKRPLGKRHRILHRHVECAPCLMADCPLDGRCQMELEGEEVLAAIRDTVG